MLEQVKGTLDFTGHAMRLLGSCFYYLPSVPRQFSRTVEQAIFIGNLSAPLVALLSFAVGAVLALQVGYSMQDFNADEFLGSIVGLAVVRELGPLMTAIIVTGRVGSAITAELASMRVYQEVDALTTMNIPPERFLVLPRMVAITLVMPVLVIVAVISGWIGGAVAVELVPYVQVETEVYYRVLKDFVSTDALIDGLIKGEFFGLSVVLICCTQGLRTSGGPREIGRAVTSGVVASIVFILIANYFITSILLEF